MELICWSVVKIFEITLTLWLSVLLFILLVVIFHELGHYIAAKAFGFSPKFQWGFAVSRVIYEHPNNAPIYKLCIISFSGILGEVAIIPVWLLTSDLALTLILVGYNFFYSIFEAVLRYKKCKKGTGYKCLTRAL
jgi:hypothetical protein